ncbi:hypothetical protein HPP92_001232 [Vanilla planifolia]|uniref:Uncharacterized protein n=1 Tax=Vanilla planifolia TaxID=51239 RepID=A0A835VHD2_VANPL|nr:hypothetical protein HPP92_001232 [Vanilla planifolia]
MFQSCIKLDEMDILKQCFDEWQSVHMSFDVRLPYLVMSSYLQKDMIKEAELVLEHVTGSGDGSFTWEKFISYHLKKSDVDLALRSLKFATCDGRPQQWIPNKELVKNSSVTLSQKMWSRQSHSTRC